ncbi:ZIP family metal transporter [Pseudoflavonifractor capillosus]|uniref:ZIP family metal transporter n=1 Tax=Pseudoflavonifractor capillosus TaxID=106588 RepID=UPI00174E5A0C|nr:ZIP family metal transporter [Pseudoflavonifractor capillosus]MBM6680641.1 ZIP family metal transporter [Pseudoflavonifractor capillosus]MBS6349000.1 ZIP family metal transporter [Oscillospiraceae bacterium]
MTALGSATVFLFRSRVNRQLHQLLLGFAAGVMIAASMWSLLIPAIEAAEEAGLPGWFPAAGGSVLGVLFLVTMNTLLPHLTPAFLQAPRDGSGRRSTLLVLAIAMHNIPEGMAVGISFALAARSDPTLLPAAMALALGIGIQNFPEGAAISLPLRQAGMSRKKSFLIGAASGAVEPIAALFTVLAAGTVEPLMPWLLSFAAGAMLYVVVEELIPEANLRHDHESRGGTCGVMAGFLIMMILDVALG